MRVFDRELQDSMYRPSAYLLGHLISCAPQNIIQPLLFAAPIYFMSGLRLDSGGRVVNFLVASVMLQHVTYALAFVCVALSRHFQISSLIANTSYTFIGLASGFLINFASLPVYVAWIKYVSFQSWSFRLLLSNELSGQQFPCPYPAGSGFCAQYDGNAVLQTLGIGADEYAAPWVRKRILKLRRGGGKSGKSNTPRPGCETRKLFLPGETKRLFTLQT